MGDHWGLFIRAVITLGVILTNIRNLQIRHIDYGSHSLINVDTYMYATGNTEIDGLINAYWVYRLRVHCYIY